ncbi:MAG: PAS domain-containing protein, partial [Nitrospirae bacterium]|nr:PAS domain-containing protein [Nitrospirota bacterium]
MRKRGVPLKGISRRLTLLAFLIVTIVIVIAYLYEGFQHKRLHDEILRDVVESPQGPRALLKEFIVRKMRNGDIEDLREELLVFQKLGLLQHICIFDSSGRLWFRSGTSPVRLPVFNDKELICTACHGKRGKHDPDNFTFALRNGVACERCHGSSKGTIGYVYARMVLPGMDLIEQSDRREYLFIYFIMGAIVLFIGGGYVHYYIVRRLQAINRAITSFEAGQWEPVKDETEDEIAEISRSFNRMAERIISTQAELNKSRAYLKNLLDNMTDMVVVIDRQHVIQYVNRATLEFLNKGESDVIGRKCHEVFHKSPVPCYLDEIHGLNECGLRVAFSGRRFSAVHSHITDNGKLYIHLQYIPFYQDGAISYVIEMARDITETYKLNEQKAILATCNETLQNVTELSELTDRLVVIGKEKFKADAINIFLYDNNTGRLQLFKADCDNPLLIEHIREVDLDECVASYAVESGEPYVAETIEEFPEGRLKPLLKEAGINQIISIPIKEGSRVVGVYNLACRDAFHFRKEDGQFLGLLMETINRVYQRIRHYEEVKEHGERLTTI